MITTQTYKNKGEELYSGNIENLSFDGQSLKTRLGEVLIYEENIINFPEGLLGFEHAKYFVLGDLPGAGEGTNFSVMQSLEFNDLCFIILNTTLKHRLVSVPHIGIYNIDIINEALAEHGICTDDHELTFIVSINTDIHPPQITINTSAPIVIEQATNKGAQIVLHNSELSVVQPIYE